MAADGAGIRRREALSRVPAAPQRARGTSDQHWIRILSLPARSNFSNVIAPRLACCRSPTCRAATFGRTCRSR